MDTGVATKPYLEPSDARFSLRGMLLAALVVALFAAIGGPFARSLARKEQIHLLTIWGLCLVGVICWVSLHAYKRYRAEAQIGQTFLNLPVYGSKGEYKTRGHRNTNVVVGLLLGLLFLSSATGSAFTGVGPGTLGAALARFGFMGLLGVAVISHSITLLWSGVRFGEHGVLVNRRLLRWTHILECGWLDSKPKVLEISGIDQHNADVTVKIPLTNADQAAVRAILEAQLPGPLLKPQATIAAFSSFGGLPLSTIARTKHLRRHLAFGFLGAASGLALLFWAFSQRTGVPEFDRFIFWGIVGFPITRRLMRKPGKYAGAPLVRIFARRDIAGFVATVVVAIALYAAGLQWGWSSILLSYVAGFGYGFAAVSVIAYFARTQLDLAEHGIVLRGAFYWPWQKVRVISWNNSPSGRLVLGRGWRRLVAIVPPEQRESVSTVLKEKLPAWQGTNRAAENMATGL